MQFSTDHEATIRELTSDDAPGIEQLFHRLSDRSRYLRFASATPRLTDRLRRHLTGMDGDRHVALGAFAHGSLAGMAHFIRPDRDAPARHAGFAGRADHAEFAIAVADAAQGQGIGRRLLRALLDDAAHRGIRRLAFTALPDNAALLALVVSLGARYRIAGGLAEGHIPVPPQSSSKDHPGSSPRRSVSVRGDATSLEPWHHPPRPARRRPPHRFTACAARTRTSGSAA